jgi:hypothetical protein
VNFFGSWATISFPRTTVLHEVDYIFSYPFSNSFQMINAFLSVIHCFCLPINRQSTGLCLTLLWFLNGSSCPLLLNPFQTVPNINSISSPWRITLRIVNKTRTESLLHYLQGADRPDDGGSKYLWKVGKLLPDYTTQKTVIFILRAVRTSNTTQFPKVIKSLRWYVDF